GEEGREDDLKRRQRSDDSSIEMVHVVASNARQLLPENRLVKRRSERAHLGKAGLYAGGGAGDRLKSKQSDMSSACASLWFSASSPNKDSQKRTRLTCECRLFEM